MARKKFNRRTYYNNKKILKELGVPFYEYGFNSAEHIGNDDEFPKIDILRTVGKSLELFPSQNKLKIVSNY